jgi:hypothetical protein
MYIEGNIAPIPPDAGAPPNPTYIQLRAARRIAMIQHNHVYIQESAQYAYTSQLTPLYMQGNTDRLSYKVQPTPTNMQESAQPTATAQHHPIFLLDKPLASGSKGRNPALR